MAKLSVFAQPPEVKIEMPGLTLENICRPVSAKYDDNL